MFDRLGNLLNDYIDDPQKQQEAKVRVFTLNKEKKEQILKENETTTEQQNKTQEENIEDKIRLTPKSLENDFKRLQVPAGTSLAKCKKSYLNLLKKYHPDKHTKNPSDYEKATLITKYVTESYRRIQEWYANNP